MSKGLKQMLEDAQDSAKPVQVSGEAVLALSNAARQWSGVPDATVRIARPDGQSPYGSFDHNKREFTVNADALVLNPHRVLLTVTPFRLRQEAVLTGVLMHEAGHARHSKWLARTEAEYKANPERFHHSDGTVPSEATIDLARLFEEARIEGLMARDENKNGAPGLGWTMRASTAHLLPSTHLSADPNQAVMDVIKSYVLRAGRYVSLGKHIGFRRPPWAMMQHNLLVTVLSAHFDINVNEQQKILTHDRDEVMRLIHDAVTGDESWDRGPSMIDAARDILDLLFPETPEDERPEAGSGCGIGAGESGQDQDSEPESGDSESGAGGEGDTESDESEPDSGEDSEDTEPEDSEPEDSEPEDSEGSGSGEAGTDTQSQLAQALASIEASAAAAQEQEVEKEAVAGGGLGGVATPTESLGHGFRRPTVEEREIQKGAEKFLRKIIAPAESSKRVITASPSSVIDGAALEVWKHGARSGHVTDPRFFSQTRRQTQPSPPVKIAVLVDVSGSMDDLQAPSALLSWALSSAALDLKNFAGRGTQIESCLIHWGSTARVIQKNGETLPGIKEVSCTEGTWAMHDAMHLVEEQMPGFFDESATPENRLLVQFTDWELNNAHNVQPWLDRLLTAGVNMLSVVPREYGNRWSQTDLPNLLKQCKTQRGKTSLLKYNPMFPDKVWDEAAQVLGLGVEV